MTPDHAARAAFEVATSANLSESHHALRADAESNPVLVRGTKRMRRWREVPIVTDWQRELMAFACAHARGRGGKLFLFDAGYHGALGAACVDAKLPHTTSNDLRRTFCHWMKDAGVPRELVATTMGHIGTKMVDQVYGKPNAEELARQMLRAIAGTTVAQTPTHSADPMDGGAKKKRRKSAKGMPRPGFEPGRGVPPEDFKSSPKIMVTPRAYKRNRDYEKAADTDTTQLVTTSTRGRRA